jgi:hypothetical protein
MGDPAQDYLDSGGATAHPLDAANDSAVTSATNQDPAQAYLDSGGKTPHPLASGSKKEDAKTDYWVQQAQDEAEANTGSAEAMLHTATGVGSTLLGGFRYAMGADRNLTDEQIERNKASIVYQPRTEAGKAVTKVLDNAATYTGQKEGQWLGPRATDAATALGFPPQIAGGIGSAAETLANVPQYLLPAALRKVPGFGSVTENASRAGAGETRAPVTLDAEGRVIGDQSAATGELTVSGANRPAYFEINDPQTAEALGIKPDKAETPANPASTGNLSPDQQAQRVALAKRIGLSEVRTSAITGDAQAAADDFDSTKYTGTPMGDRLRPVIAGERQALVDHASGIVDDLGAREGSDQSTLIAKGKTMAKPLDMLADHIDDATSRAYETAKEKAGPAPLQFPTLEAALKDRTLTNSLLAQGKEGFLKGVQSQWDDFKANNPEGVNAAQAEQYRQFLNTLWKTNPDAVGKLKGALDSDMYDHFGEDIFGQARQLHQLGKTLLDNPKGVSQIAGKDPQTPANRTTAYEDIPDKVANLSGDQFKNLINTYRMMPDDLQPQAQAAIGEIQGHMVNRLLDAGSKTEGQWNKKGVNTELSNNSENFKTAFADNPDAAAKIKDLKDAGEMLRFNSSYRGAHAQSSNMVRQGVGAGAEWTGAGVGGAVGTFVAGPGVGTTLGAMAGKAAVGKGLGALDAAKVRKGVESRVTKLGGS